MKGMAALAYDFTGGCGMTGRTGYATYNVFPFSFANSLCSPSIERCIALIAGFGRGVAVAALLTAPTSKVLLHGGQTLCLIAVSFFLLELCNVL